MASSTRKLKLRRKRRDRRAAQGRKAELRHGTTPAFPIDPDAKTDRSSAE